MGWRDLLQDESEVIVPWISSGIKSLSLHERTWKIEGKLPQENGWYSFKLHGRVATVGKVTEANPECLRHLVNGYLVGDRIIVDDVVVDPDPSKIVKYSERVHLIENGLDRFIRIKAGRASESGPLIYYGLEMPFGPEEEVLSAFLDQKETVDDIIGVVPALDAAFRMESWQRTEAERRRLELERLRKEEEERRIREEKRQELIKELGDGVGRRRMALVDFAAAARAALGVGGATYLDHRRGINRNEMVVRFRFDGARYECVCDERTLRIIDAGICLTDERTGIKYDNLFSLESLPAVIREAIDEDVLVVFRHVY